MTPERFTNAQEMVMMEPIIKEYIYEAIDGEKAGLEGTLKKSNEFTIPEEFQSKLEEISALITALETLTPGR
jgi:uncharacterized protein YdeI (YjbR/CyaY-like superfamily)